MGELPVRSLHYSIAGVSALVGRTLTVDQWAREFRVPNRKVPGTFLTGEDVHRITGIEGKSWDPELFGDFSRIVAVGREAMQNAQVSPQQIDQVIVATSTPYEIALDSDAFRLLRGLRIPDHVAPIQLCAGCAGMARAMTLASHLDARRVLIVSYEISSLYMMSPVYRYNTTHPKKDSLWMSPALFSDGAAAVVLCRDADANGCVVYSRDSLSFGDGPGFEDPLIHYPGGGGLHPPGTPGSDELACYGMSGDAVKQYYLKGMMLNHEDLARSRPEYLQGSRRIYTHQASPRLVDGFIDEFSRRHSIPRERFSTNARTYGNLVIPSTVKMLYDDIAASVVTSGNQICVSVVGAGPERGAFSVAVA